MNKKNIFLSILIFSFSCSSVKNQKNYFNELLDSGQCEKAFDHIPESNFKKVTNSSKEVLGTGVRYLFSGVGYTTDIVIVLTGFSIMMSPFLLASGSSGYNRTGGELESYDSNSIPMKQNKKEAWAKDSYASPAKNKSAKEKFGWTSFGPALNKMTVKYPCPDLSDMTDSIFKISECFIDNNQKQKGIDQLENILFDSYYLKCLDHSMKLRVENRVRSLKRS